jgi:hypothetical protein
MEEQQQQPPPEGSPSSANERMDGDENGQDDVNEEFFNQGMSSVV